MILNRIIRRIRKPETMRAQPVLVIHHLGTRGPLDPHVRPRPDLVLAVLRGAHVPRDTVLRPHDDVLPVVAVAPAQRGLVALKVVPVHVRAPARVAARARVDLLVVRQVPRVAAAVLRRARALAEAEARVEEAVRADGGDVVAAVCVEVQDFYERLVSARVPVFTFWETVKTLLTRLKQEIIRGRTSRELQGSRLSSRHGPKCVVPAAGECLILLPPVNDSCCIGSGKGRRRRCEDGE